MKIKIQPEHLISHHSVRDLSLCRSGRTCYIVYSYSSISTNGPWSIAVGNFDLLKMMPVGRSNRRLHIVHQSKHVASLEKPQPISHGGDMWIVHRQVDREKKNSSVCIARIGTALQVMATHIPSYRNNVNLCSSTNVNASGFEYHWTPFSSNDHIAMVVNLNPMHSFAYYPANRSTFSGVTGKEVLDLTGYCLSGSIVNIAGKKVGLIAGTDHRLVQVEKVDGVYTAVKVSEPIAVEENEMVSSIAENVDKIIYVYNSASGWSMESRDFSSIKWLDTMEKVSCESKPVEVVEEKAEKKTKPKKKSKDWDVLEKIEKEVVP